MMRWLASMRARDPAARGLVSILLCYPGLHALWNYRLTHRLWRCRCRGLALWLSYLNRCWTGIEIHPGAVIGKRLLIDHGTGVVIGETAQIGDDCLIYHGVTLGGNTLNKGKRHPTLGNKVIIGAGAKVIGAITLGDNVRVGANAVVTRDVPDDEVVVGIPGRMIKSKGDQLQEDQLPDLVGEMLRGLQQRIHRLEEHNGIAYESGSEPDYSI